MSNEMMNVDRNDLKELKKLYKHAVDNKLEQFKFKDRDLVTSYAKYLIEYLDSKFYPPKK